MKISGCSEKFTCEPRLLLGLARIHDMLNDPETAIVFYKKVLVLDASSIEAIACLGAHYFYSDQVCIFIYCAIVYFCRHLLRLRLKSKIFLLMV